MASWLSFLAGRQAAWARILVGQEDVSFVLISDSASVRVSKDFPGLC